MAILPVSYGPTPDKNASEYYRRRGIILSGSTQGSDLGWLWEDFDAVAGTGAPAGWTAAAVSSGTADNTVFRDGGWSQMETSGTAGSSITHTTESMVFTGSSTDRWYVVQRLRFTSAIDAQTRAISGIHDSLDSKSIVVGVFGPGTSGTTNFLVFYDGVYSSTGSYLDTGTAIATNTDFVFELYSQGDGEIRCRVDEGAEVSATMSGAATSGSCLIQHCGNGTTATARTMARDFIGALYPRS